MKLNTTYGCITKIFIGSFALNDSLQIYQKRKSKNL